MSTEVPTWGAPATPTEAAPPPAPHPGEDDDCGGTCAACQVKAAGGRAIAAMVGVDYDTAPAVEQGHLRHMAGHVYSAMSEAILAVPGIKSFTAGALRPDGSITEVDQ